MLCDIFYELFHCIYINLQNFNVKSQGLMIVNICLILLISVTQYNTYHQYNLQMALYLYTNVAISLSRKYDSYFRRIYCAIVHVFSYILYTHTHIIYINIIGSHNVCLPIHTLYSKKKEILQFFRSVTLYYSPVDIFYVFL